MQDDDLFASEMSGVTPLKREPRERLLKKESVDVSKRRQAATTVWKTQSFPLYGNCHACAHWQIVCAHVYEYSVTISADHHTLIIVHSISSLILTTEIGTSLNLCTGAWGLHAKRNVEANMAQLVTLW